MFSDDLPNMVYVEDKNLQDISTFAFNASNFEKVCKIFYIIHSRIKKY